MLQLDHLVILVRDLEQAVADYQALGFTITPGGTHADGLTHNVLVVFADGTYLELIAFLDANDSRDNVWGWRQFLPIGGLIDFCLASSDLARDTARLRQHGLPVGEPSDGGRNRLDGTALRWRSARFEQSHRVLPFLIEDVTPRALRVPNAATPHPNGVTGIVDLTIMVADLDAATRDWGELQPAAQSVQLVAGSGATPGPFSVRLTSAQPPATGWLDAERTQGVRMEVGRSTHGTHGTHGFGHGEHGR